MIYCNGNRRNAQEPNDVPNNLSRELVAGKRDRDAPS
jgi:hypothetical protein